MSTSVEAGRASFTRCRKLSIDAEQFLKLQVEFVFFCVPRRNHKSDYQIYLRRLGLFWHSIRGKKTKLLEQKK
jgi:hypothetical protein